MKEFIDPLKVAIKVVSIPLIILFFCGVAFSCLGNGRVELGTYYHLETNWESLPDGPKETEFCNATVFRLCNKGEFIMVECMLLRSKNRITISVGDGLNTYRGTWHETDMAVSFRLTSMSIPSANGDTFPGPERRSTITKSGDAIAFDGMSFDKTPPNFSQESIEMVIPCGE